MEKSGLNRQLYDALGVLLIVLSYYKVNGQISTPCSASMITSFTPCLNFITGSTSNGQSSPSADCCDSVKSMMTDSMDCACLIITGNIPLSLPFNRTLAISLPRACNGGVPIRCKSSGVPLPPPGPVLLGPTQAPTPQHSTHHPPVHAPHISPRASKASSAFAPSPIDDTTKEITPAFSPNASHTLAPGVHPGIRPVFNPAASSASLTSHNYVSSFLLTLISVVAFRTRVY